MEFYKKLLLVSRESDNSQTNRTNMKTHQSNGTEPVVCSKLFDLSTIRYVSDGDEDFVKKMIALFVETVPDNLKDLNTSLTNENWDMVSKAAHKLKSTIDSMGIYSIKQEIRAVEITAKKKEALKEIPALVRKINMTILKCLEQLQNESILK